MIMITCIWKNLRTQSLICGSDTMPKLSTKTSTPAKNQMALSKTIKSRLNSAFDVFLMPMQGLLTRAQNKGSIADVHKQCDEYILIQRRSKSANSLAPIILSQKYE